MHSHPDDASRSLKIFVIGTGRSGTHWLGHILESHPAIHVTIERPPIFSWATKMALDARRKRSLLPRLIRAYQLEHAAVAPKHYADKSHPNIWHAEDLAAALPESVFLGIRRSPYATVASMLKHPGVLQWHARWREFPVPNRFLGITQDMTHTYGDMPLAAKCAVRWRAHAERLEDLRVPLGRRLLVVHYEDLIRRPDDQCARLSDFLRLATPIPRPAIREESLDRWRTELSAEDQRLIADVTGITPDEASS